MNYRKRIGKWGEDFAARYLEGEGISIVAHNVFTPYGEIDLVGREGTGLIFVEVKTRTNKRFGNPEDSINARKREHLIQSALFYIQNHPEENGNWRIDVISIQKASQDSDIPHIEWFKNAVQ